MKKAILFTSAILIFSMSLHAQEYEKSQNDTTKNQETHQHEDADQAGPTEKDTDGRDRQKRTRMREKSLCLPHFQHSLISIP